MQKRIGFDNEKYIKLQKEEILKRIDEFGNKLYLEIGGKLFDDYHAARVLPGFDPNIQIKLLQSLKNDLEIILCVSAEHIEKNKIRADFGITYDMEVLRLLEELRKNDLYVSGVVITLFNGQVAASKFAEKLKLRNERVYFHTYTKGYPTDVDTIVSEEGYGQNPYIETSRKVVVVTAPGPGSGKLATCLSQLYHEYKRGEKSGYAKYEKFPVWDLPLKSPVNVAYEAATADLKDINMIDPYHMSAYGEMTVNYNRDIECFPVVKDILIKITGEATYLSPTCMGVNRIRAAITDQEQVDAAARQELIRRYYKAKSECKKGNVSSDVAERIRLLMNELRVNSEDRRCVGPALKKWEQSGTPAVCIELADGTLITGRQSATLTASAGAVLNAIKHLAGIADKMKLIIPGLLEPISALKRNLFKVEQPYLSLRDVLFVLSICARDNEFAKLALEKVNDLDGCEVHSTHILEPSNEDTFRLLNMNVTSEDNIWAKEGNGK